MPARRPNILLLVVDCARSDKWLDPQRRTRTPQLDQIRASGLTLPTTITEKSCTTPSFATLLTGRYSPRHGVHLVWGYRLPDHVPLLTDALAAHGYHTYAEVTGPLLPEMGLARGFASYEYRAPCDYLHTAWGDEFVHRLRSGGYREPWFLLLHLWELHPPRVVLPEFDHPAFGADRYERAVSSLDAQLARLFDAVGDDALIIFTGDHGEKTAAESYREGTAVGYARTLLRIDSVDGVLPHQIARWAGPSVLQRLYGRCVPLMKSVRLRDWRDRRPSGAWTRTRDLLRLLRLTPRLFFHDLLALGAPLRLTAMLRRRGLLDERRAARKADRFERSLGLEKLLDMHMRMWVNSYKHNLHEGHMIHVYDFLVRVPLVLRWRGGLPGGGVCPRMVRQPDILPTVLDLLGLSVDAAAHDGRSFRALIDGLPWEPPPAYLSVSGIPSDLELAGVRTEEFKYTFGPHNPELPQELYDLRRDPGETENLAGHWPERCRELRALAAAFTSSETIQPAEQLVLSAEEQREVEQRLRQLGYIE